MHWLLIVLHRTYSLISKHEWLWLIMARFTLHASLAKIQFPNLFPLYICKQRIIYQLHRWLNQNYLHFFLLSIHQWSAEQPGLTKTSERKATKTLGIVLFVFITCWKIHYICILSSESLSDSYLVVAVVVWIIYIYSFLNPIIYGFHYLWFRASVKHILIQDLFFINLTTENSYIY